MKNRAKSQWRGIVIGMLLIVLTGCAAGTTQKPQTTQKKPKPQTTTTKPAASTATEAAKLVDTGVARLEAGDVNKAISSFRKALKVDPKNADAAKYLQQAEQKKADLINQHLKSGIKYFNNEQLELAMNEWEKALALDPKHAKALEYKQRTQAQIDALQGK